MTAPDEAGASMQHFVILTRGRTGSSAVAEELGCHPEIVCHGELARPGVKADGRYNPTPLRIHAGAFGRDITAAEFSAWLDYLAEATGEAKAAGFKLLENHLRDIDGGAANLRGLKVIHLQRRNLVRQAVSGMLAKEVAIYNSKTPRPKPDPIWIDPVVLNTQVRRARRSTIERAAELRANGVEVVDAYYEDWVADPRAFYRPIFGLLGVEDLALPPTTWQPMAPHSLDQLITNYAEISRRVRNAGFGDMLVGERAPDARAAR